MNGAWAFCMFCIEFNSKYRKVSVLMFQMNYSGSLIFILFIYRSIFLESCQVSSSNDLYVQLDGFDFETVCIWKHYEKSIWYGKKELSFVWVPIQLSILIVFKKKKKFVSLNEIVISSWNILFFVWTFFPSIENKSMRIDTVVHSM